MAYELPIDSKGLDDAASAIDRMVAGVDKLDAAFKTLNGDISQTRTLSGRAVALPQNPADGNSISGTVDGGIRGGRSSSLDPFRRRGVRDTLAYEESMLSRLEATGDETSIKDQRNRVLAAQKRVEKADRALDNTPKTREEIIADILNTSRIDRHGNLFPLVGKLRQLGNVDGAQGALEQFGVGRAAELAPVVANAAKTILPMALGAAGMAAGGAALFGLANAGYGVMSRKNAAFYDLGGSAGDVGAAMGLGGPNASSKAMAFSQALSQGSAGSAFMASRGIQYQGRYTDYAGNYVRGVRALRDISDVQERVRVARETGLSDDLWTSELSPSSFNRLMRSRGAAGTPEARQQAAEYKGQLEEAGGWVDGIKEFLGGGAIGLLQDAKALLWDIPGGMSGDPEAEQAAQDAWEGVKGRWVPGYKPKKEKNGRPGGGTMGDKWQNVEPVMQSGPVTINGDTSGAIPVGWRMRTLNDVIENQRMMVGAFNP